METFKEINSTNTLLLHTLDVSNVTKQIETWNSTTFVNVQTNATNGGNRLTIGDFPDQSQSGSNVQVGAPIGNITLPNYQQPYYYPYTWISYGPTGTESNFDKVLVTKAENGFVLVYNNKTYIAKNETEVAKIIVKVTKIEEKK